MINFTDREDRPSSVADVALIYRVLLFSIIVLKIRYIQLERSKTGSKLYLGVFENSKLALGEDLSY